MNAAQAGKSIQFKLAQTDFKELQAGGMTGSQTFAQWVPGNAVGYTVAVQAYKAKVAAYQKAISNAYGPLAAQKLDDEAKLEQALDNLKPAIGWENISCLQSWCVWANTS